MSNNARGVGGALMVAMVLVFSSHVRAVPITEGMVLWLDATDSTTLFKDPALTMAASNGDAIGGWRDKSGNGFHAVQDDSAIRPVLHSTAMNGMPAVRFSGREADGMIIDSALFLERPYTAFIVNQYYGNTKGRTLQGRDANWLHGLWAGNVASYADGFVGTNTIAELNFPYVADTTGTPVGDTTFFVNGADFTTNPGVMGRPGGLGLVSGGAFPGEVSDADISEVVIYDRVLSNTELGDVRNFLYNKYNVTPLTPPDLGADPNTVHLGSIGTFTGGDAGDGLDLSGTFAYAINVGGPGDVTVADAQFTDGSERGMSGGSSPGAMITNANEIPDWHPAGEYGDSASDDALETVMQSIRWNTPPGLTIDLNVQAGLSYKLQLLFAESCCNRGFDITIEDQLAVDNFNVQELQGGINNGSQGVFFVHELKATDGVLNIALGGANLRAPDNNPILNGLTLEVLERLAQAGDADQDGDFDQLDLVRVQVAAKYLTGRAATWGEGDWDGAPAPGGVLGNPPPGDGLFNQVDIIASLAAGFYLKGPYAALQPSGKTGDGQTSIGYNPGTGEVWVDAPAGAQLTSVNIDSAAAVFTGDPAQNLGGSFDNDADGNIFKATFGSSFGSINFGKVARTGLSEAFVLGDLSVVGSLAGGGALGSVDLIYVPEPRALLLTMLGVLCILVVRRCKA
jgi:hypothetical protein